MTLRARLRPKTTLGAVFIVVTAVLASGCGGAPTSSDDAGGGGAPQDGGTLTLAAIGGGQAETLDPTKWLNTPDQTRIGALYDQLTALSPDGSPQMLLAREITPNGDGTEWTMSLREGVTFHDGTPMTADDVLYSIRRVIDSGAVASATLSTVNMDRTEKVDDHTIVFRLNAPAGDFPAFFVDPSTSIVKNGATDFEHPIGTGPFKYKSWTRGDRSVFERNDSYWGQKAHVDELVIVPMADETARTNALLSGALDVSVDVAPTAVGTLEQSGMQITSKTGAAASNFYVRADTEPTKNPAVREALALAIDRQKCVDVALQGKGTVASDLFGLNFPSFPKDAPQISYDPDRARSLLEKAGLAPLTITLTMGPGGAGMVECAQVFQESAKDAGITINIETIPGQDVFNPDAGYLSWDFGMTNWIGNSFQDVARLTMLTDAFFDEIGFANPEFDKAFAHAQGLMDADERNAAYAALAKQVQGEHIYLVWGYGDFITAHSSRVQGLDAYAGGKAMGFRLAGLNEAWVS
ncbi:ABC transporter substrate-binding protein [Mycolicibacterium baixiangningiae]|uniref:ABC transporter substrate-binding protein n=1 Tax=Mycolicibacterium baixiangningiae TaxID=2761578 RepID=UPI0018D0AD47|nr:ABC transporter substrate-binding protein [Mycolicibacterium baixiangningiae]